MIKELLKEGTRERLFFMHRVAERKMLPGGNRRPAHEQGAT